MTIFKCQSGFYSLRKLLSQNLKERSELEDVLGKNVPGNGKSQGYGRSMLGISARNVVWLEGSEQGGRPSQGFRPVEK